MGKNEAQRQHFVPQFLLRPWTEDGELRGYFWNARENQLACKLRGTKSFCFQIDLLTLQENNLGRDAIERVFFGEIDTRGAEARDKLLNYGPRSLTVGQRQDFARLILSLEARRPGNVSKLRSEGRKHLAESLDNDPEILAAMAKEGLAREPSSYVEQDLGMSLEDRSLALIQGLVDNSKVGGKLINAFWEVIHLGHWDGTFVLSDRPLIRIRGYDDPGAIWVLPLTPTAAFVAANHSEILKRIKKATPRRFAKLTNVSSTNQTERFLFCADNSHEHWIGKQLRP